MLTVCSSLFALAALRALIHAKFIFSLRTICFLTLFSLLTICFCLRSCCALRLDSCPLQLPVGLSAMGATSISLSDLSAASNALRLERSLFLTVTAAVHSCAACLCSCLCNEQGRQTRSALQCSVTRRPTTHPRKNKGPVLRGSREQKTSLTRLAYKGPRFLRGCACCRYAASMADAAKPYWESAATFYESALRLSPGSGTLQNQLAVVAQGLGSSTGAALRFAHAVAAASPFDHALGNLMRCLGALRADAAALLQRHSLATVLPPQACAP